MPAKPPGKVVGIVEAGAGGREAHLGHLAEGMLSGLESKLVAHAP